MVPKGWYGVETMVMLVVTMIFLDLAALRWGADSRDLDVAGRDLRGELADLRADSAALVEGLSPSDLARGGTHAVVGRLTVADLLQEWVHHDRNHIRQLFANVQAAVWPHMGNARRFSELEA